VSAQAYVFHSGKPSAASLSRACAWELDAFFGVPAFFAVAGDDLAEVAFLAGVAVFVALAGDAFFTEVAFLADVLALEGELFFVTLPLCTWSSAASWAFVDGTERLGEDLIVRSGLAAFVLVDLAGEALRVAFAGVAARDFAIAGVWRMIYCLSDTGERDAEVLEVWKLWRWTMGMWAVLLRNQTAGMRYADSREQKQ
jgi:hypothetical protein